MVNAKLDGGTRPAHRAPPLDCRPRPRSRCSPSVGCRPTRRAATCSPSLPASRVRRRRCRLGSYGPNLVARESKPSILQEIWVPLQKPSQCSPARSGGGFLFSRRRTGRDRDRADGPAGCRHGFRPGASLQRGGGPPARHGEDHRQRAAARARRGWRLRGGSSRDAGARRRGAAVRRRHDPGRPAAARDQGLVHQPVRADRRGHAGGEVRPCLRATPGQPLRPAQRLLHGRQRRQRLRHRGDRAHGGAHLLRATGRRDRRPTGTDRVRPGYRSVHLADAEVHRRDGARRVPDQRPHQARLARGAAVRGGRRGRPDAGIAAHDRHRQSGQGRARHVARQGDRQAAQCHPELRRHGRAVRRQDRDADAGPHHPQAASRHPRRGVGARPAVRLSQQPLSSRA